MKFQYVHLPAFLKACRLKNGISQGEFAEAIGMHFLGASQFISSLERGKCTLPIRYWKKTAKYLEITVSDLTEEYIKDERQKIQLALL